MDTHRRECSVVCAIYERIECPNCGKSALKWKADLHWLWMCYNCGEVGLWIMRDENITDKNHGKIDNHSKEG